MHSSLRGWAAWRLARISGYADAVMQPILALDGLHLVFQAQFQLFKPDFFQLFIFAEITFLGECIEAFCILRVLLSQSAEFLVIGQELVSRSQHPADLQPGYKVRLAQAKSGFNAKKVVQSQCEKRIRQEPGGTRWHLPRDLRSRTGGGQSARNLNLRIEFVRLYSTRGPR